MTGNSGKAVVLVSGGLDSATVLALALERGYDCAALTFRYGQRHEWEIECARRICKGRVSAHRVIELDPRVFSGSALTDEIDVPRFEDRRNAGDIPATYVPARNTVFLSYALAWADANDARDIFIGVNAVDYSGYPDCRPEFIQAFEQMANLGTRAGAEGDRVNVNAPLISMSKGEIVRAGIELGVDYSLTSTCYSPDENGIACGECEACGLRLGGFAEAGFPDPVPYRSRV